MHAVVETQAFTASARQERLTPAEIERIITVIAADPTAGEVIVGSGGCRKVRIAARGKGKSGGFRVVTFYASETTPVFLLWVLSKSSRANFTAVEVAVMHRLAKSLTAGWRGEPQGSKDGEKDV